jgi:transmembrane sensor
MDDQPNAGVPHDPTAADSDADASRGDPQWDAVARQLAGEADPASRALVDAWRRDRPDDATAVDALDATLSRLAFTAPPDLDVEAALRKVKQRRAAEEAAEGAAAAAAAPSDPRVVPLRRPARPAWHTRWMPRTPALRAAAVLGVVATGAALWSAARGIRGGAGGESEQRFYTTTVGQTGAFRLSDGTRVTLGPASRLTLARDYGASRRELELRGEAYFEVRHDAARPFVVRTAAATLEDVGTAFVVREGGDGRVVLAVTDGAVQVAPTDPRWSGARVVARRRDRVTVVPGQAPNVEPQAVPLDASEDPTAWTRGQLVFHDATFPDVSAELRRWYGVELRAADSALAARHLTATFHGEPVDEVLRVVGLALGASVERRGDTAIVRVAPTR